MNFYCPDCKEAFYDEALYSLHMRKKCICPHCHMKFEQDNDTDFFHHLGMDYTTSDKYGRLTGGLTSRLKSSNTTHQIICEDKTKDFTQKMRYEIRKENDSIDDLRSTIADLRVQLDACKKQPEVKSKKPRYDLLVEYPEEKRFLLTDHDISDSRGKGYSSDGWKTMILTDNDDLLLGSEFSADELVQLNKDIVDRSSKYHTLYGRPISTHDKDYGYTGHKFLRTLFVPIDSVDDNNESDHDDDLVVLK